jgi:hypothetical protein
VVAFKKRFNGFKCHGAIPGRPEEAADAFTTGLMIIDNADKRLCPVSHRQCHGSADKWFRRLYMLVKESSMLSFHLATFMVVREVE